MTEAVYQTVRDTADSLPQRHRFSVSGVLNCLGVSKSGYYDWISRKPSARQLRQERIKQQILDIYEHNMRIYGAPKITEELHRMGETVSERTVTKYMQELGIRACYTKPYTVTTISEDFTDRLHNILSRDFNPDRPDAVWCTDITYVWTKTGFVYLSCVMDLFSRRILAWELSETLETKYVIKAIAKARIHGRGRFPRILHTDRGTQYTSAEYRTATEGTIHSYSRTGNPWDNACMESFHALIKREWLDRFQIRDYAHAHRLIFEYIDAYYNTRRIHSHCGYLPPLTYENKYYLQLQQTAA